MIALAISAAVYGGLIALMLKGPRERLVGGVAAVCINYGLRRLLFLTPPWGDNPTLWRAVILMGDGVFVLALATAFLSAPAALRHPRGADLWVAAALVLSVVLATADIRTPTVVRLAHWKEEYLYVCAWFLARWTSWGGGHRLARSWVLHAITLLTVLWAAWQGAVGPTLLDQAWIASGQSVLTAGGPDAVVGAHGLGDLEEGWMRPYGIFGNGTDMGVFLSLMAMSGLAAFGPASPLLWVCAGGVVLTVVRFAWAVFGIGVVLFWMSRADGAWRWLRALTGFGGLTALACTFIAVAPVLRAPTLVGRAFVLGTYGERIETQISWLRRARFETYALGEGFGRNGAAARKFDPTFDPKERAEVHSRVLDFIRDGGIGFLALMAAPLLTVLSRRHKNLEQAAMMSFCLSLALVASVLGGKSALLSVLYWAALGIAYGRQ